MRSECFTTCPTKCNALLLLVRTVSFNNACFVAEKFLRPARSCDGDVGPKSRTIQSGTALTTVKVLKKH